MTKKTFIKDFLQNTKEVYSEVCQALITKCNRGLLQVFFRNYKECQVLQSVTKFRDYKVRQVLQKVSVITKWDVIQCLLKITIEKNTSNVHIKFSRLG